MKLYYSPGACSLASHIAFSEAGLPVDLVKVDLRAKTYGDGEDYNRINPKGSVPALMFDDGQVLTEGVAIMQWVADQVPEKNLIPIWRSTERYTAIEWLNFIATEVHKGLAPLWKPNVSPEQREAILTIMAKRFDLLQTHLEKIPFLLGETFTVPDAYLFTVLNWAHPLKIDLSKWSALTTFQTRVSSRHAVTAALKAEGLLK